MSTHEEPTGSSLSELDLRVRALESVLIHDNYVTSEALEAIVDAHETRIGPHIGARAVARAWVSATYREALLVDATAALPGALHATRRHRRLGRTATRHAGRQGLELSGDDAEPGTTVSIEPFEPYLEAVP